MPLARLLGDPDLKAYFDPDRRTFFDRRFVGSLPEWLTAGKAFMAYRTLNLSIEQGEQTTLSHSIEQGNGVRNTSGGSGGESNGGGTVDGVHSVATLWHFLWLLGEFEPELVYMITVLSQRAPTRAERQTSDLLSNIDGLPLAHAGEYQPPEVRQLYQQKQWRLRVVEKCTEDDRRPLAALVGPAAAATRAERRAVGRCVAGSGWRQCGGDGCSRWYRTGGTSRTWYCGTPSQLYHDGLRAADYGGVRCNKCKQVRFCSVRCATADSLLDRPTAASPHRCKRALPLYYRWYQSGPSACCPTTPPAHCRDTLHTAVTPPAHCRRQLLWFAGCEEGMGGTPHTRHTVHSSRRGHSSRGVRRQSYRGGVVW
jgi:hypothetical protein